MKCPFYGHSKTNNLIGTRPVPRYGGGVPVTRTRPPITRLFCPITRADGGGGKDTEVQTETLRAQTYRRTNEQNK